MIVKLELDKNHYGCMHIIKFYILPRKPLTNPKTHSPTDALLAAAVTNVDGGGGSRPVKDGGQKSAHCDNALGMEATLARAYSGMARGAGSWRIDGRDGG
jgi:hypothetical protein